MPLNNKLLVCGFSLALLSPAVTLSAGDGVEPTGLKDVTEKLKATCAEADKRYQDVMGDIKEEAGTVTVKMYKYTFCPPNIEIKKGTTVRWVNVDKRTSHSVWLKQAGEAESERFFPEELWSYTFNDVGKFPYLCGPHWEQEKMYGHVTVTPQ